MSKLSILCVALLAACGGSKPAPQPAPTPTAPSEPSQETTPVAKTDVTKAAPPADIQANTEFSAECMGWLNKAQAIVPTIIDVKDKRTIANTLEPFNQLSMFTYNAGNMAGLCITGSHRRLDREPSFTRGGREPTRSRRDTYIGSLARIGFLTGW